jgi:cytochrome c1
MRRLIVSGAIALAALVTGVGAVAIAAGTTPEAPARQWKFEGPFGTYDRAAAQRGYQVYQEVCSACHSLSLLAYRNLSELGLTDNQVKGLIKDITVSDLGDDGQPAERPARLSDRFKKPFPNDLAAAAANNGKAPPDLSVMAKARANGPNYLYALLTGYVPFEKLTPDQIKAYSVTKDDNYNTYFPGHRIAMAPPLSDDRVTYADGTKATLGQQASDVTEFLAWASEPHMEDRKRTGVRVILFLLAMAGLMYAVKRQVWSDKH